MDATDATSEKVSTGTEITSADEALLGTEAPKERRIIKTNKKANRDNSPHPAGTKQPYIDAKKYGDKLAFADAMTLLERQSSVISWPENQQKVLDFKNDKFAEYTHSKAQRQHDYVTPKVEKSSSGTNIVKAHCKSI
jgi:hypothetical protein